MQDSFARARTRPMQPLGQARARRYGILYTSCGVSNHNFLSFPYPDPSTQTLGYTCYNIIAQPLTVVY